MLIVRTLSGLVGFAVGSFVVAVMVMRTRMLLVCGIIIGVLMPDRMMDMCVGMATQHMQPSVSQQRWEHVSGEQYVSD